jgi:hypothetical protein
MGAVGHTRSARALVYHWWAQRAPPPAAAAGSASWQGEQDAQAATAAAGEAARPRAADQTLDHLDWARACNAVLKASSRQFDAADELGPSLQLLWDMVRARPTADAGLGCVAPALLSIQAFMGHGADALEPQDGVGRHATGPEHVSAKPTNGVLVTSPGSLTVQQVGVELPHARQAACLLRHVPVPRVHLWHTA